MHPYLSIEKLDVTFSRGPIRSEVLRDISLRVEQGEFIAIIGHSGCGKSTLLNVVAGLVKATSGGVLLEDKEVNEPGPDRAVVFQHHSLLPWLTVFENVQLAVDKVFGSRKSRSERREWVMHNLALVHIEHAKDKRPHEISGGMKQRVGIARALGDGAEGTAARRALRRARRADPGPPAGPGDGDPRQARQHGDDDHPRRRRGGPALRPDRDDDQWPGGGDRRHFDVPFARPRQRLVSPTTPSTTTAAPRFSNSSIPATSLRRGLRERQRQRTANG